MRLHFWFIAFSLFFLVLTFGEYLWLAEQGISLKSVPLVDFFLITLATMRLVRLFTYDVITEFIRNWFSDAPADSFRGTLGALLNCPWCSGLWFASLMVFLYFAVAWAWYLILILAVASLTSILQIAANWIGWSAEYKKRTVLGLSSSSKSTCG